MNNLLKLGDPSLEMITVMGYIGNMKNRMCRLEIVLVCGLKQVTMFGVACPVPSVLASSLLRR